jgi:hypothetical protein
MIWVKDDFEAMRVVACMELVAKLKFLNLWGDFGHPNQIVRKAIESLKEYKDA